MFTEAFAQTLPGLQAAVAQTQNIALNPITLFLNGFLGFLSPCIIPLLPVYAAFVVGDSSSNGHITKNTLLKLAGLMLGFVLVFSTLGALGGLAGGALSTSMIGSISVKNLLDILGNILIIVFGLMMLGLIPGLSFMTYSGDSSKFAKGGFFQNIVFGAILVLSWTPCLTPTLGLALAAATQSANALDGIYSLMFYALGLSLPLLILMLLYQKLSGVLQFLKKNSQKIRKIAGIIMIVLGVLNLLGINPFVQLATSTV